MPLLPISNYFLSAEHAEMDVCCSVSLSVLRVSSELEGGDGNFEVIEINSSAIPFLMFLHNVASERRRRRFRIRNARSQIG